MGVLSDRLDSMRVRASSPDGMIVGELRNRTEVYLSFVDGTYRRYGRQELEDQLVGLARRLWVGRTKEYYAAVSAAFGETITGESPALGRQDVAFYAARDDLVAEGRSVDGRVQVTVQGMRDWTVRIADGTLRALTEEEFGVRVREAAAELIRDQPDRVRELKQQFYD